MVNREPNECIRLVVTPTVSISICDISKTLLNMTWLLKMHSFTLSLVLFHSYESIVYVFFAKIDSLFNFM